MAVMLAFNPLLLRDDLGFQLSFLAMIALLYFYPLGIKLWGKGKIREPLMMTLMAQLLTWPVIAANFGNISLIAPLANILAVWIFAGLLPGLLLAVVLGLLFPAGAVWWFAPDYLMLKYLNTLSVWLAAWPHACPSYTVPEGFVVIYYLILAILYTIGTAIAKRRHRLLTGD
jgi:competence protein ComEC